MAKKQSEEEVLDISVDLKSAMADMAKWERAMSKNMGGVGRAVDKLSELNKQASKSARKGNEEVTSSVEDLADAYRDEAESVMKTYDAIIALQRESETANKQRKKEINENILLLKKQADAKTEAFRARDSKEGRTASARMFKESSGEAAEDFKKVFEDASLLFSKDLKSSLEGGAKFFAKTLKMGVSGLAMKGPRLQNFGAGLADRGKEKGGAMGGAMQLAGNAMKSVGGLMSKLGPLVQSFSKMAPMIGMVSTAVVGLVKLFLDLDAKAKEFNKDILQSAGTSGLLAKAGRNADLAFSDVEDRLKGLRDAAHSFDNIEWGLKADDHKGIINVLTQEGIALENIGKKGKDSAEEVEAFATELAHVSVAYSRAFGIPLQEINQLQAEMVQDLGIGLGETKLAFEQINRSAAEAGVGANKFFSMIRGVSQDLSLWNNRMQDATLLLGKLMKNMSPRTAQSFFQTLQKGFKGMGRTELLKTALLNGVGTSMKTVNAEIARNIGGLAQQVGSSLGYSDEQVKALADQIKTQGRSAVEPLMDKLDDQTRGAVNEALSRMELMQSRAKKGAYGLGEAMSDLGPVAAAEAKRNIAMRFASGKGSKGKDMISAAGEIGVGAMAENQGIDVETYNNIAMMEKSMEDQRKILEKRLGDPETQKKLAKAGIKATKDGITEASWTQLMDTMSEEQQDLINGVSETEKMAKKQAKAQTSFYDRFEILVDFLMNKLYNVFLGIWDSVTDIIDMFPGGDSGKKDQINAAKAARKTGNLELQKLVDAEDFNKALSESGIVKTMNQTSVRIGEALKERSKLESDLRTASPEDQAGIEKRLGDLDKELDTLTGARSRLLHGFDRKQYTEAAGMAGVDEEKISKFLRLTNDKGRGDDITNEVVEAFGEADLGKVLEKVIWSSASKADKITALGSFATGMGGAQAQEAAPTATPAPQSPATTAPMPVQPVKSPEVEESNKIAGDNLKLGKDQLRTMQSIDNQIDRFKMDTSFLSGPYSKAMEGSSLKAMRTALFEYYMYKDLDQSNVVSAMQAGAINPGSFSESFTAGAAAGKTGAMQLDALQANAGGGVVTGVSNGLAQVTAAAGEGLASVGPGERIVSARGGKSGGDTYQINVQGVGGSDLARYIEAKVIDGVHEYKRKERFQ